VIHLNIDPSLSITNHHTIPSTFLSNNNIADSP
jgi:hypothetical protein